jgi:activator of Hsp90 ATPase-like protein
LTVRRRLSVERTYSASPEEVWELWTTKEGIEAWWGPEGFSVTVGDLDLRPGGELHYVMTATGPDQVAFMVKAGMPISSRHKLTFIEVDPPARLAYRELADFIPEVEPYEVENVVEFQKVAEGTRLVSTFEAMHDDRWTEMAKLGRESELGRLAKVLAARE